RPSRRRPQAGDGAHRLTRARGPRAGARGPRRPTERLARRGRRRMSTSRIPAFYQLTVEERRRRLAEALDLSAADVEALTAAAAPGDVEVRLVRSPRGETMVVVHVLLDTGDAMGANAVNSLVETLSPMVEEVAGGTACLRILSNLADRRLARAAVRIPFTALERDGLDGAEVAERILYAYEFAAADPYRAATHNKGIMNGIDALAVATGNDWR